jgi:molybdenum cofactor synthesis domain-containing protein
MEQPAVTAALLVIGDEILSGRTKDKNMGYVAEYLTGIGIDLKEVRVVPDEAAEIVAAIKALRWRYTYLLTTGGIGPTHDDITADCVAQALDVGIDVDERAKAMMLERYKPEDLNEARLRMARIPFGASLIENPISRAPGFRIENVIVMAGVPAIMQAMLDNVAPTLETGVTITVEMVDASGIPEGRYATELGALAASHEGVSIGSYPSFGATGFRNQIVVRSKDPNAAAQAAEAVRGLVARLSAEPTPL